MFRRQILFATLHATLLAACRGGDPAGDVKGEARLATDTAEGMAATPTIYLIKSRDTVYARRARLCASFSARVFALKNRALANAPNAAINDSLRTLSLRTMQSVGAIIASFAVDSSRTPTFHFVRVPSGKYALVARGSRDGEEKIWVHRVDVDNDTLQTTLGAADEGSWLTFACGVSVSDLRP